MKNIFKARTKSSDRRTGQRITSRVASSDTAYLHEINTLNTKVGKLLVDKNNLLEQIKDLKQQLSVAKEGNNETSGKIDHVETSVINIVQVDNNNNIENKKDENNNDNNNNNTMVKKDTTNSPTRKQLMIQSLVEKHEMLAYLQRNIDKSPVALTYYSVKKNLIEKFGQETFDIYKQDIQTLLAKTAEELALVQRNQNNNMNEKKANNNVDTNNKNESSFDEDDFGEFQDVNENNDDEIDNIIDKKQKEEDVNVVVVAAAATTTTTNNNNDVIINNNYSRQTNVATENIMNKKNEIVNTESNDPVASGGLWVWGQVFDAPNDEPQLATRPRQHLLEFDVVQVACNWQITSCYYLTKKGDIFYSGTGDNHDDDNMDDNDEHPRIIRTLAMERALSKSSRITKVSCGSHFTLALTSDGRVYSWGDGAQGSLGHGTFSDEKEPRQCVALLGQKPITQIATGSSHSVFLSMDNNVYTCGEGNDGRLGLGDVEGRSTPTKVDLKVGAILNIKCGWDFTSIVAIEASEAKKGKNIFSQFFSSTKILSLPGESNSSFNLSFNETNRNKKEDDDNSSKNNNNSSSSSSSTNEKKANSSKKSRRKSTQASDARSSNVIFFGNGKSGQCGSGERKDELYPYVISTLKGKDVVDVSCGHAHCIALCANGDLYGWGDGDCGQTGTRNILELLPQKVDLDTIMPSSDKVVTIACGPFHTVVGTKFGHVYSWGQNSVGALGVGQNVVAKIGTPTPVLFPFQIDPSNNEKNDGEESPAELVTKIPGNMEIYCGFNTTFVNCKESGIGRMNSRLRRDSDAEIPIDSKLEKSKVEKLRSLRQRWQEQIIPQWHTISDERWVIKLIRSGIPFQIRQYAWPRIIGNTVKITPKMYEITVSHAKKLNEMSVEENSNNTTNNNENASLKLISTDLARTFPSLDLFGEGGVWTAPLRECLEAFALHRPDLGYVQGMSYIAAMLLLHIPNKYITFQCLVNLMVKDHLFVFYMLNGTLIKQYLKIFDLALEKNLSAVARRLKELDISADMYLFPWIQTVFLKYIPLSIASRIWDNFLLDGVTFLFRTSLAILTLFSNELLKRPMEDCMKILQKHNSFKDLWRGVVTEEDLFKAIEKISIPPKLVQLLDQICNDVYKFL